LRIPLSLLLIAALSFGGALIWQRMDENRGAQQPAQPAMAALLAPVLPQSSGALSEFERPASFFSLEFELGPFTQAGQVLPSPPVDPSYFYDAVFFGDTLATGLITHRLVGRGTVFAAIGAPPLPLPEDDGQPPPPQSITMLEAAAEQGDKNKVYILFGGDSLHLETGLFIDGYRGFLRAVRARYPGAVIYLVSIPPVGVQHGASREVILEKNAAIARLASENAGHFLNFFEAVADDAGYLPPTASRDGIHLTAEYYFFLLDYLMSHTVHGQ